MVDVLIVDQDIECHTTKYNVNNVFLMVVMFAGPVCFHATNARSSTEKKMRIHVKDALIITVPDVIRIKTYAPTASIIIREMVSSYLQKTHQTKSIGLDSRMENVFDVVKDRIIVIKKMLINMVQAAPLATMRALTGASNVLQSAKVATTALHVPSAPKDITLAMAALSASLALPQMQTIAIRKES